MTLLSSNLTGLGDPGGGGADQIPWRAPMESLTTTALERRSLYNVLVQYQQAKNQLDTARARFQAQPLSVRQSEQGAIIQSQLGRAQRFINQADPVLSGLLSKAMRAGYIDGAFRPRTRPPEDFSTGLGAIWVPLLILGALAIIVFFVYKPQVAQLVASCSGLIQTTNDIVRRVNFLPPVKHPDPNAWNQGFNRSLDLVTLGLVLWGVSMFVKSRRAA